MYMYYAVCCYEQTFLCGNKILFKLKKQLFWVAMVIKAIIQSNKLTLVSVKFFMKYVQRIAFHLFLSSSQQ